MGKKLNVSAAHVHERAAHMHIFPSIFAIFKVKLAL